MKKWDGIFSDLGIRGDITLEQGIHYELDLGKTFRLLCDSLQLGEVYDEVQKLIVEYALFKLLQKNSLSDEDIKLLELYEEEVVINLSFGEILDRSYCNSSETYYEAFGYLLNDRVDKEGIKKRESIINSIDRLKGDEYYIKNEGTFFCLFKDIQKRYKIPFNKAADKLNEKKDIEDFGANTLLFMKKLSRLKDYNFSEDVINFESYTNALLTFTCCKTIEDNLPKLSSADEDLYLNILASLSLIEDVNLKLFLARSIIQRGTIIQEDTIPRRMREIPEILLCKLYSLSFLYPIVVEKYLEKLLLNKAKEINICKINANDVQIDTTEKFNNIKRLKEKMYIFELLRDRNIYDINKLINQFENIRINNLRLYKNIYTRISNIKTKTIKSGAIGEYFELFRNIVPAFNDKDLLKEGDFFREKEFWKEKDTLTEEAMGKMLELVSYTLSQEVKNNWRNVREKILN